MKAIVLAGGHATRLWPLTRHRAKPLLPLGDQPIISYIIHELRDIPAVDEVLISTNAKFADDFETFITDGGLDDVRVVVEDHETEEEKIGSLGAIIQVIEQEGKDDYVVVGGDNYTELDLADFVSYAQEQDSVVNACYELEDRADASAFGVVATDGNDTITSFEEKPENPPSNLVSTAFYCFPERQLDLFDTYVEAHQDSDADYLDEPGRLIEWAHSQYDMYAYAFDGSWFDIGTPQNYLRAQAALADSFNHGTVTDSDTGENVWVMEGAHVESSTLKNCIIFPEAEIRDAELENCIIDKEATVDSKELENAVIGEYSTIR